MSHDSNTHVSNPSGFFYRKDVIKWILFGLYACCTALVAVDFLIHRHIYTDIEKIPAFYAIYGCVACIVLVIIARWMRIILIRDENYYDEPESPEEFLAKPTNNSDILEASKPASNSVNKENN